MPRTHVSMSCRIVLVAALACAAITAMAAAPAAETTLRLDLSDGSRIVGRPEVEQVEVKTAHGELKLKWEQIRTITWKTADTPGEFTMHNGDTLSGQLAIEKLSLKTILGNLAVPLSEMRRLAVTVGGGGAFSLRFDGKQNYVEVPADAALDPLQSMTLECWYKTTARQTQDMLGKRRWRPDGFDRGYEFNVNEGRIEGYWWAAMLFGPPGANDGRWHHAAMTWDGRTQRLFDDGREVSQTNPARWTPADTTFRIGGVDGNANGISCFEGSICQVRLSKVDRYGDKNFTPQLRFETDENTIALWDFSEGAGDVVHDKSGNGHDGKFVGDPAPQWIPDVPTEAPQPPKLPPVNHGAVVTAAR
jgi:hypothetical protein